MKIEELTTEQLKDLEDRILRNTEEAPNGCWIWKGSTAYTVRRGKKGKPYGIIYLRRKDSPGWLDKPQSFAVRRVIFRLYNSDVILGELVIESTCGNTLCLHPDHLVHILKRKSLGPKGRQS